MLAAIPFVPSEDKATEPKLPEVTLGCCVQFTPELFV
jgi:hypothetical protein